MASNHKDEPKTAPQPDRWYNLTLGSSFKDHNPSSKFCTLRYEFKPASIDKNQTGSLHKTKDNRVTVGFQNNQPGKPKVNFEGSSEDYKENDAVLLFDGETMRLERLHRAVKRLRHVRLPGESAAASAAPAVNSLAQAAVESSPPPMTKVAKFQSLNKSAPQLIPVEVERIEIGNFNSSAPPDAKPRNEKTTTTDYQSAQYNNPLPEESPDDNKHDDLDEQLDILNDDDDDEEEEGEDANRGNIDYGMKELVSGIDINQPHGNGNDTDEEIADVDVSDDEEDKGRNAAEELRAQVNNAANKKDEQSSSSSGSSGSDSSGSGSSRSGSSSSDSESSEAGDSVNSI